MMNKSVKHSLILTFSLICAANVFAGKPEAQSIVDSVRKEYAPDRRQSVFEVVAEGPSENIVLTGKISDRVAYNALLESLNDNGVVFTDSLILLPDTLWAQPRISVACIRVNPAHAAEMATQALMGQPLRILEKKNDWYRIQMPDGYIGWVTSSSIVEKSSADMEKWRSGDRLIVTSPFQTHVWNTKDTQHLREIVSDVVNGNIVTGLYDETIDRIQVELPDGRKGWISTADVTPLEQWAAQDFNPEVILDIAYSMEGTPYLWGGTSVKSLDCSGLAKVSYLANGIILMRDASQQALTGKRIEAEDWESCQAGDLLFFGNAETGRVTHVAIYDHDGDYVHSSGRVKRNSVNPASDGYLTTPFLHAVRIHGYEDTNGITFARNHPWYFNKNDK